jgi:peroxiredoxin
MKPTKPSAHPKRTLLILIGIVAVPTLLATALFFSGWRPAKTINTGELVTPARPLPPVALRSLDRQPVTLDAFRQKWLVVYFGPAECHAACQDNLYKMRQAVAAQGKEQHRIERLFVVTDVRGIEKLNAVLKEHPGLHVAVADPVARTILAEAFRLSAGSPLDGLHRVYVVDPLGNLMMSYATEAPAAGMRRDLARLLHVSKVG